jgi:hypothetical protein
LTPSAGTPVAKMKKGKSSILKIKFIQSPLYFSNKKPSEFNYMSKVNLSSKYCTNVFNEDITFQTILI